MVTYCFSFCWIVIIASLSKPAPIDLLFCLLIMLEGIRVDHLNLIWEINPQVEFRRLALYSFVKAIFLWVIWGTIFAYSKGIDILER